jgi:hypothetical protein
MSEVSTHQPDLSCQEASDLKYIFFPFIKRNLPQSGPMQFKIRASPNPIIIPLLTPFVTR